jgi:carbon storage regulator
MSAGNLVLTRKPGERLLIGDDITITFIRYEEGRAHIGIEAPRDVVVLRQELKPESVRTAVKRRMGI